MNLLAVRWSQSTNLYLLTLGILGLGTELGILGSERLRKRLGLLALHSGVTHPGPSLLTLGPDSSVQISSQPAASMGMLGQLGVVFHKRWKTFCVNS